MKTAVEKLRNMADWGIGSIMVTPKEHGFLTSDDLQEIALSEDSKTIERGDTNILNLLRSALKEIQAKGELKKIKIGDNDEYLVVSRKDYVGYIWLPPIW